MSLHPTTSSNEIDAHQRSKASSISGATTTTEIGNTHDCSGKTTSRNAITRLLAISLEKKNYLNNNKIMKFQIAILALVLSIASFSADAYAPASLVSRSSAAFVANRIPKTTKTTRSSSQLFSQWDGEEEDGEESKVVRSSASFEEAGKAIGDEDDKAAMDDMGDFDASGTVSTLQRVVLSASVVACINE